MSNTDILDRIFNSIAGIEHETGDDVDKLLADAAGEISRLRRECLQLRAREIAELVIARQRPGQDYATHPGRQLETTTKQQKGSAGKNE